MFEKVNPETDEVNDNLNQTSIKTATERMLPLGTKRDVAAMLKMSVRSVDNYIMAGCPVIKLSPRRCRFDLLDVREWFKNKYGQQRRKSFA
jgi:hypothetical protein